MKAGNRGLSKYIKRIIKKIISEILGKSIYSLALSDDIKVVSFDLYDTLVVRKVGNPNNVFKAVEEKYKRIYGKPCNYLGIREKAEEIARKKSDLDEVSFDDIFDEFLKISGFSRETIDKLKVLELETEFETSAPNNEVIEIFNKAKGLGYKVIIVSDMYLDQVFLEEILIKCGIRGYKKIYVSSSVGKAKKKGKLFSYVLDDLNIESKDMLHIGDNPISDYFIPKMKSINSFLYKRNDRKEI